MRAVEGQEAAAWLLVADGVLRLGRIPAAGLRRSCRLGAPVAAARRQDILAKTAEQDIVRRRELGVVFEAIALQHLRHDGSITCGGVMDWRDRIPEDR